MRTGDRLDALRYAFRTLRRTPGFTAVAVLLLGIAIGAVAGLFGVVHAVLLRPLPFAEPDRLVHIAATAPGSQLTGEFGVPNEFYVHYRERSALLENLSTYNSFTNTLRVDERAERIRMSWSTSTLFATLGAAPVLGRLPTAEDRDRAVVISDRLWADWFGRDPAVLGRSVILFGEPRTLVGVMGPEFRFPDDDTRLWISDVIEAADIEAPGRLRGPLVGRLRPGVTPAQLAQELTALARELPARFGEAPNYVRLIEQHRAVVRPVPEQLLGRFSRALWVMLGAAALVLLIACANVANLFLVRGEARYREMAVRSALGAGRRRLLKLQLTEALLVSIAGGVLALALAAVTLPVLVTLAPQQIPRLDQAALGPETLAVALVVALFAGLFCGLWPALRLSRPDLGRLRDGGRGLTAGRHQLRQALVIGQTALALTLLIGSALLWRSVQALQRVDPGYDPRDVYTFQIAPERPELADATSFARFHLAFLERLAALPGVTSVGLVENVPINEGTFEVPLHTERSAAEGGEGTRLDYTFTAGDYFRTMGIAVLAGRPFTADEQAGALGSVIVSRSAAARLWPGEDPIGKRLQRPNHGAWETVVGVVEDVMQDSLTQTPDATVYFPLVGPDPTLGPVLSSPAYVVKTPRADTIAADIRALGREVAPEAPIYREFTLAELVANSMIQVTFLLMTLGLAAVLALVLGAIGLYGVLSCAVIERTREIGVRLALGARASQVRTLVLAQGGRTVLVGIAIGLLGAFGATRALDGLLFAVEPVDTPTYVLMALALLAVGLLASYLPARRASSLDPIQSLRRD